MYKKQQKMTAYKKRPDTTNKQSFLCWDEWQLLTENEMNCSQPIDSNNSQLTHRVFKVHLVSGCKLYECNYS